MEGKFCLTLKFTPHGRPKCSSVQMPVPNENYSQRATGCGVPPKRPSGGRWGGSSTWRGTQGTPFARPVSATEEDTVGAFSWGPLAPTLWAPWGPRNSQAWPHSAPAMNSGMNSDRPHHTQGHTGGSSKSVPWAGSLQLQETCMYEMTLPLNFWKTASHLVCVHGNSSVDPLRSLPPPLRGAK